MITINEDAKIIGIDKNYTYPKEGVELCTIYSRIQDWLDQLINMDNPNIISARTRNSFVLYEDWVIGDELSKLIVNSSWRCLDKNKNIKQLYTNIRILSTNDDCDEVQFAYSFGKHIKKFPKKGDNHAIDTTEAYKEFSLLKEVLEDEEELPNPSISIFMVIKEAVVKLNDYKIYLFSENPIPVDMYQFRKQARVYEVVKKALSDEDPMGVHHFMEMIDLNKFPKEGHFCAGCDLFVQNKLLFYKPDTLSCTCYKDVVEVMEE